MEFGSVPGSEIDTIDFSLPPEPAFNKKILSGQPAVHPGIYLGCAKWGREEWLGKIYPPQTKEKDFLKQYVQQFNAIELNATHYKLYGEDTIKKWAAAAAGKDFKFCPKLYQGITHRGSLNDKQAVTGEFLEGIAAFKEFLGPTFIQLSDAFSPGRKKELFAYLKTLPTNLQFFLEVRHPGWFEEGHKEELFSTLNKMDIGAVITDTAGRRDCAHMYVTVPKVFIRYVGNRLHPSDYARTDAWIQRIQYWLDNGLQEVYFFMHVQDMSPELTVYWMDKMNAATGLKLKKPNFVQQQKGLFD
jgi:uncharacterized protein YecE (DUF72 family)